MSDEAEIQRLRGLLAKAETERDQAEAAYQNNLTEHHAVLVDLQRAWRLIGRAHMAFEQVSKMTAAVDCRKLAKQMVGELIPPGKHD